MKELTSRTVQESPLWRLTERSRRLSPSGSTEAEYGTGANSLHADTVEKSSTLRKNARKLNDRLEQARIAFKMMQPKSHNNNAQQEAKHSTHKTDNTTKTNDNEQEQDNSEDMEESETLTASEHGSGEESEYYSEAESTSTTIGHEAEDEDEGETTVIEGSSTEDETDKDGTPQKPTEQQEDSKNKNDKTKETNTPNDEESSFVGLSGLCPRTKWTGPEQTFKEESLARLSSQDKD